MVAADKISSKASSPNGREMIDVYNPVTSEIIGQVPATPAHEVAEAVARARAAQPAWEALGVKHRAQVLQRWADLLWEHQTDGIATIRRENGKCDSAAWLEFLVTDGVIQYYIHQGPRLMKSRRRRSIFPGIQWGRVHYKPHGVVGVISPWNYPFNLAFMDMIPALIAGNTIVLKPSEITPFTAQWGVDLMHQAGIPRDVVQVVHGDGRTGAALVDVVDFVQFTGSTAVGRKVGMQCAERLIPYSLELGGKDSAIILDDADVDFAATGLIRGKFENAGQMCLSIERVYVEQGIYDRLIDRIQHYMKDFVVSAADGMDVHMGSMTNARELARVQEHIQDAVAKGAKVLAGGQPRPDIGPLFHDPTILTEVDHSMLVMRDETFGPVLPIMKVRSADEAIRLANDNEYGLSSSIFSSNHRRAVELALKLDTGDVSINRAQFVVGTPDMPSGGQRNSGLGRRNGPEGFMKYLVPQSVLVDNLMAQQPALVIADNKTLFLLRFLRAVRRYVPFI